MSVTFVKPETIPLFIKIQSRTPVKELKFRKHSDPSIQYQWEKLKEYLDWSKQVGQVKLLSPGKKSPNKIEKVKKGSKWN
ncbi:hypothetical protein HK103_007441 [Boothiomyces macroporosus]|uniref:Uncharacterized protein n=1 Tax=Boothiomyces macroporosus TaxID=261099 RepID=A0AAD5UNK4_9FUNG|nr:hypothetical protein HK103_007441 [Boothiomyces macroporosus]KAJ3308161.1 hypothetical protein HDV04_001715 [Boothiomyces sp. JEL0838]